MLKREGSGAWRAAPPPMKPDLTLYRAASDTLSTSNQRLSDGLACHQSATRCRYSSYRCRMVKL